MGLVSIAVVDNIPHMLSSKSVVGLRHLIRKFYAICIILSVNSELLMSCISVKLLWIAFIAACFVAILLVVSYPVRAWSAGRHLASLSPYSAVVRCLKPAKDLETFDDLCLAAFSNNSLKMDFEKIPCMSPNA